jgi:chemotaxis protein CheD
MLPLSRIDTGKARETPCMFTDTGVPRLLQQMFSFGAKRSNMIVKIAGASSLFDERGMFKIGERNYIVLRKVLDKNNLLVAAEDVKGCTSRTLSLFVKNGRTIVKKNGREEELN